MANNNSKNDDQPADGNDNQSQPTRTSGGKWYFQWQRRQAHVLSRRLYFI